MEIDEEIITKDVEVSVACLPKDYGVLVGWDPQQNQDVGWITLKLGTTRDFSSLQLRDYNMNVLLSQKAEGCSFTKVRMNDNVGLMSDKNIQVGDIDRPNTQIEKVPEQEPTLPLKKIVELENLAESDAAIDEGVGSSSETKEVNDIPEIKTSIFQKCDFCNRKVTYLPYHLPRCPGKNAKNQDRVKCPFCDFNATTAGLSSHIRTHVRVKKKCPICGNEVYENKYDDHLKTCNRCAQCGKIFRNKVIFEKHMTSKHPVFAGQRALKVDEYRNIADGFEALVSGNTSENVSATKELVEAASETAVEEENGEHLMEGQSIFPEYDIKEARCSLCFVFMGDGIDMKTKITALMTDPVEHAFKKFCKSKKFVRLFGHRVDQLDFKSNDTLLTGEELIGSIDGGLINVKLRNGDSQTVPCFPNFQGNQTFEAPVHGFWQQFQNDSSLLGSSEAPTVKISTTDVTRFGEDEMSLSTQYVVDFSQF